MAFSGLQAPILLFSAGDAATCPLRRNRHGEAGAPCHKSIGARRPVDLGERMQKADSRPSRSAAVVTIMKNLSRRVIAGGALQDYLTDDADERRSGLGVDRRSRANSSVALSRVACSRVTDRGLGGLWDGWRVAGRRRCVCAAAPTSALWSASHVVARACCSPVGECCEKNRERACSMSARKCILTFLQPCLVLVGADWVLGDIKHVTRA